MIPYRKGATCGLFFFEVKIMQRLLIELLIKAIISILISKYFNKHGL